MKIPFGTFQQLMAVVVLHPENYAGEEKDEVLFLPLK
jgi:hypothetical protein